MTRGAPSNKSLDYFQGLEQLFSRPISRAGILELAIAISAITFFLLEIGGCQRRVFYRRRALLAMERLWDYCIGALVSSTRTPGHFLPEIWRFRYESGRGSRGCRFNGFSNGHYQLIECLPRFVFDILFDIEFTIKSLPASIEGHKLWWFNYKFYDRPLRIKPHRSHLQIH